MGVLRILDRNELSALIWKFARIADWLSWGENEKPVVVLMFVTFCYWLFSKISVFMKEPLERYAFKFWLCFLQVTYKAGRAKFFYCSSKFLNRGTSWGVVNEVCTQMYTFIRLYWYPRGFCFHGLPQFADLARLATCGGVCRRSKINHMSLCGCLDKIKFCYQ